MISYHKTQLKNGLRIITAPMKETKAVTILVLVGTGSRFEKKRLNGISHFLEHMFFKGTAKRPSTLDISQELDAVGADYNAFTSEEQTGFYIRIPSDHFSLAMDVLIDILFNSKFDSSEIEREKSVITEEINMYQDTPQRYIFDLSKKLLFGDNSLGRQTLGSKESIKKFQRQDFIHYRQKFYNPSNMVLTVAGNQNGVNWIKEIKNYLEKFPQEKGNQYQKVKIQQQSPRTLLFYKKTDQAHLNLYFPTFPRTDKRRTVLKVFSNILGETMSSRLFTQVRERRGLAYYIGTDFWDFRDNGAFMAYAGVDIKRLEPAIKVIVEEFSKMKKETIREAELVKAKENLKGSMYLGLEDSMSVASFLTEQELFWPQIETPEEIIEKIFRVSAQDIMKLAQQIFDPKKINLTIISPLKQEEKFVKILKNI